MGQQEFFFYCFQLVRLMKGGGPVAFTNGEGNEVDPGSIVRTPIAQELGGNEFGCCDKTVGPVARQPGQGKKIEFLFPAEELGKSAEKDIVDKNDGGSSLFQRGEGLK